MSPRRAVSSSRGTATLVSSDDSDFESEKSDSASDFEVINSQSASESDEDELNVLEELVEDSMSDDSGSDSKSSSAKNKKKKSTPKSLPVTSKAKKSGLGWAKSGNTGLSSNPKQVSGTAPISKPTVGIRRSTLQRPPMGSVSGSNLGSTSGKSTGPFPLRKRLKVGLSRRAKLVPLHPYLKKK